MQTHELAKKLLELPDSTINPHLFLNNKQIPLSCGGDIEIKHELVNGFNDDYDYLHLTIHLDPLYTKIYLEPEFKNL